jgi:hypothetical protein
MVRQRRRARTENVAGRPGLHPERLFQLATAGAALLLGFAIAAYVQAGLYTRYWADDFCTVSRVRQMGLWDAQIYEYDRWSGRFSAILATDLLAIPGAGFVPFWALFLLGSLLAALTWALAELGWLTFGRRLVLPALVVAEACLLAYILLLPNQVQSLYWLQGSATYTLPLVFACLLTGVVAYALRAERPSLKIPAVAFCFGLAFLAAGFSETFALWQIAAVTLAALACAVTGAVQRRRLLGLLLVASLAGAVAGAAVVAASPGNETRQEMLSDPLPVPEAILKSLDYARSVFRESLSDPVVLLVLAVTALVTYAAVVRASVPEVEGRRATTQAVLSIAAALLLVAVTYLPGTYVFGEAPPPRSLVTAEVSVVAAAAYLGFLAGMSLLPAAVRRVSDAPTSGLLAAAGVVLLALAGLLALPPALGQLRQNGDLAAYARAWDQRDDQIREARRNGAETVSVRALGHEGGLLELSRTPSFWVNGCMADYYGIDSIQRQQGD